MLREGSEGSVIWPLESRVAHEIRASINLASISQAINICIKNSIDAGSSEIHVDLDIDHFSFTISDNGSGIRKEDMHLLGTWNTTSSETGKGEGLASICSVAVVDITSRAANSFETMSCLYNGSELIHCKLAHQQRDRPGTVIRVHDLLFNRPVARKMIVLSGLSKEFSRCKSVIQRLVLLRTNIAVMLYDRQRRCYALKLQKGRSQHAALHSFFGESVDAEHMATLSGQNDDARCATDAAAFRWSVTGWTVRPPYGHPTSSRQLVYVHGRPVKSPEISKLVSELYTKLYKINRKVENQWHSTPAGTRQELLSLEMAKNRHAMYVIVLSFSNRIGQASGHNTAVTELSKSKEPFVDILSEPEGDMMHVRGMDDLLHAVHAAFLEAWNPVLPGSMLFDLQNTIQGNTPPCIVPSDNKNIMTITKSDAGLPYNNNSNSSNFPSSYRESKHTIMHLTMNNHRPNHHDSAPVPGSKKRKAIHNDTLMMLMHHSEPLFHHHTMLPHDQQQHQQQQRQQQQQQQQHDLSLWPRRRSFLSAPIPQKQKSSSIHSRGTAQTGPSDAAAGDDPRSALDSILFSWKNPAMMPSRANTEHDAPVLALEDIEAAVFVRLRPQSLERAHLQGARALPQVDTKFVPILCDTDIPAHSTAGMGNATASLPAAESRTNSRDKKIESRLLALVDQHAADERVWLEHLKSQYISVHTGKPVQGQSMSMMLTIPQLMKLGNDETHLLDVYGEIARAWGWQWVAMGAQHARSPHDSALLCASKDREVRHSFDGENYQRERLQHAPRQVLDQSCTSVLDVYITHVPLIAHRALSTTDLRLFLYQLSETGSASTVPAGVSRILNSKACRSAIMFGDELVPSQCQRLVDCLKQTRMCFICAHGRPTTVPLVDLGALSRAVDVLKGMQGGVRRLEGFKGIRSRLVAALNSP